MPWNPLFFKTMLINLPNPSHPPKSKVWQPINCNLFEKQKETICVDRLVDFAWLVY